MGNAAFFGCTGLKQVSYGGTQAQWAAIDIGTRNEPLRNAARLYSTAPEAEDSPTAPETGDTPTAPETEDNPKVSSWAVGYYTWCNNSGYLPDGVLGSDYTVYITRAQFAALAVHVYERLLNITIPTKAGDEVFADCAGDAYMAKAYNLGILNGYNTAGSRAGVRIGPDDRITREQAATMLQRMMEAANAAAGGAPLAGADSLPFTDAIAGWAYDGVATVYRYGIMNGTGEATFSGQRNYTIEQAVTTMYRFLDWAAADVG